MPEYPDHVVVYRLTSPDEEFATTPEPLVFDRLDDAWRHAAYQVLTVAAHVGEEVPRAEAVSLLDADDVAMLHGWIVSRWAKTVQHNRTSTHTLSSAWNNGISLYHLDALDDTWAKVSTLLVRDLLTYSDFAGVDAGLVGARGVWLGIVVDCTPDGQVTFADGQTLGLDGLEQISVRLA